MRLLIYLVILLFSLSAWCQGPSVSFDRLSIEDGLSQNSLSSILQDRNGFLWFGTFDGLNRYDGYEFKVYRHNPANPNSIADDIIRTLFEDKNGNLWVGTDSGGLSRFDAKTQRFINFKHDDNNPRSLSHNRVMSITQDNHGDLWVGTYGGGLNKFNGESQDFSHFEHDPANPNSLSDNKITTIHHDGKGAIWVGTRGHGLDKYDISSKKFSHFTSDPNQPSSLSNNRIRALYVDASGDLWIGTKGGLNRYNPRQSANNKTNQDTFTRFNHKTSNPNSISSDQIRSIHQDSAGALWIGTEGSGLNKLPTLSNANFVHFENEPSNPRSISSGRINAIYEDNKGTLWVGTYGGGISKYDAQKERFGHFKHEISNPSSLNNSSIHALYVDSTDTLWVGTDRGLNRYDANQKRFTHFNHDPVNIHSISRGRINAIYEDSKGFLWVGANGSGLNRYDAKTNRFKHFVNEHSNPHSLSNDVVRTVHEDHLGTLWVGTYGGGLNRFDASTEQFSHLRHQPGNRNSLSNDLVMSIYQDSNKILWIATNGGGVNRYDISSKKFSHLLNDENDSNSLSDNRAWYIYEDMRHSLWIGTANGLNQYQHNNQNNNQNNSGQFTHYRKTDGLANNTILGISEDHAGNLWVSSNQGLSKINPTSGIIKNYNVNDGLQSNAFNQGAYFKGGDGELFFGGSNGLNRFYPHNIIDDIRKPAVAFTDFQVSNQSVPIRPDNSPDIELEVETLGQGFNPYRENNASQSTFTLSEDIQVLEHLTLTHKESQVSFAFTALDFTNPLLNQYAYQLTGWDEDWIYTDAKRRFATYTKLDAGDYVFKVKASNKDGYWNEQPKSLAITVLPPPWQTWWAYTIYTLILIAIIAAITRAEREKRRNEREVMVQLRKVDKLKDEFLANTSHELRTPLNGIIGLTESLIDGATEELNDDTKKNLAMVVTSGKRLANLVNDILDFSKLKSQDIPLNPKATDLRTSIEVTLTISATLASHKPIKLINDVPHDLVPIYADEDRLQQILFNLVGNAIKFTDEGTITITANTTTSKHGNNMIAISISDTGVGIPEDKQPEIFDSFHQIDNSATRQYGGTGLGLTVTQQLVELHGGTISVSTNTPRGSTFTFTLPVSHKKVEKHTKEPIQQRFKEVNDASQQIVIPRQRENHDNNTGEFHILVVDDEPINQQVLTNHLAGRHYQITTALSGPQALEYINGPDHSFDLILLDIMMPIMSGYEVARKVRENFPANELPIIMLTAKNQVADLVEGFSCGTNDYLAKPFSKDELIARISTQLNLVKINTAYARFFPAEFLKILNHESIVDVRLGDQTQSEMTVLFLDIRGFTSISEKMTPKQNFDFLNEFLSYVIPSIRSHSGFIDKYIGDAVMALFPGEANDAIKASIAILKQVGLFNELRESQNQAPIAIGIGLHTGSLMLGTIGDEKRMDGTVISDAVNLAARLEGLTKTYGASLVVSDKCFNKLPPDHGYHHRSLGKIQVQGKNEVVSVIEIVDGDNDQNIELKKSSLEMFAKALALYYDHDFEEAAYTFRQVLKANPDDQTASLYHHRSATYMVNGVDENWDGTEKMETK